jgi:hypothetical protein
MIKALLKIRGKQFNRGLSELGLFRVLALLGIFGFLATSLFLQLEREPNIYLISAGYFGLIFLTHSKREDKLFLKSNFENFKSIFATEYLFISTPLIISLIYYSRWDVLSSFLFALAILVHIDFKIYQRVWNTKIQRLIPSESFEWKAGLRKNLILITALWLIGMGTSFYIGSVPIVLFILGIIPNSFYDRGESVQILLASEKRTNQFLIQKIKIQILIFSILSLPLILAFVLFHAERWYIPVGEYLIFVSMHIYLILTKYAFYEPDSKSPAAQIFGGIGALCALIGIFLPVVWLLSVYFYFKSRKNLNFYLDDYN